MKFLTLETINSLHEILIEKFGGKKGIRDIGLLESAYNSPFATFGGESFFVTLEEKIARLSYGLIKNHPYVDGNKRIGAAVIIELLKLNNIEFNITVSELINISKGVAEGSIDYLDLLKFIIENTN